MCIIKIILKNNTPIGPFKSFKVGGARVAHAVMVFLSCHLSCGVIRII